MNTECETGSLGVSTCFIVSTRVINWAVDLPACQIYTQCWGQLNLHASITFFVYENKNQYNTHCTKHSWRFTSRMPTIFISRPALCGTPPRGEAQTEVHWSFQHKTNGDYKICLMAMLEALMWNTGTNIRIQRILYLFSVETISSLKNPQSLLMNKSLRSRGPGWLSHLPLRHPLSPSLPLLSVMLVLLQCPPSGNCT